MVSSVQRVSQVIFDVFLWWKFLFNRKPLKRTSFFQLFFQPIAKRFQLFFRPIGGRWMMKKGSFVPLPIFSFKKHQVSTNTNAYQQKNKKTGVVSSKNIHGNKKNGNYMLNDVLTNTGLTLAALRAKTFYLSVDVGR